MTLKLYSCYDQDTTNQIAQNALYFIYLNPLIPIVTSYYCCYNNDVAILGMPTYENEQGYTFVCCHKWAFLFSWKGSEFTNFNCYKFAVTFGKLAMTARISSLLISPLTIAIVASATVAGSTIYVLNSSKHT